MSRDALWHIGGLVRVCAFVQACVGLNFASERPWMALSLAACAVTCWWGGTTIQRTVYP